MEERLHNVNLKPLTEVIRWDTKRIKSYKDRIQKHIQYCYSGKSFNHDTSESQFKIDLERFKNYKEELKKILASREHFK